MLPVGSLLPSELDLAQSYGASRNTVRAALKQLQDMDLISRRRNRGTRVERLPAASAFTQSLSTLEDLVSFAKTATRVVTASKEVVLDIRGARELGCAPGSRWLNISMTRREIDGPAPLGWTDAFVDPHYAGVRRLAVKNPERLLCDMIETTYGRHIATIEQTVTACSVPDELTGKLAVAEGTPVLKIVRHYRDAARSIVLVTRSYYPEGRYALSTTLVRNSRIRQERAGAARTSG